MRAWRGPRSFALSAGLGATAAVIFAACGTSGTAWGDGAFQSNGERIYFTGTSEREGPIDHTGGPGIGGMMMSGRLACASCHGPDGRGGIHMMHMELMDAPDIRWAVLAAHEGEEHGDEADHEGYTIEMFGRAVIDGQHPDGDPLDPDMPRWQLSPQDLEDLADYLRSLPGE